MSLWHLIFFALEKWKHSILHHIQCNLSLDAVSATLGHFENEKVLHIKWRTESSEAELRWKRKWMKRIRLRCGRLCVCWGRKCWWDFHIISLMDTTRVRFTSFYTISVGSVCVCVRQCFLTLGRFSFNWFYANNLIHLIALWEHNTVFVNEWDVFCTQWFHDDFFENVEKFVVKSLLTMSCSLGCRPPAAAGDNARHFRWPN